MSRISLQMYTLRDYMKSPEQIDKTFQRLEKIGYQNIQPILPDFMDISEFKALMDAHGLKADSFSCVSDDIAEKVDSLCRTAQILGTNIVRTGSIPHEQAVTKEGFRRYAEQINSFENLQKLNIR